MENGNLSRYKVRYGLLKLVASLYFIALAFVNAVGMLLNHKFGFFDFSMLIVTALPLAVNRGWLYQFFGFSNVMIWLFVALAVVMRVYTMATLDFLIGLLLAMSGITFGLILVYSGMYDREQIR